MGEFIGTILASLFTKILDIAFRKYTPSIGASLIEYEPDQLESHLRLVNIGYSTIHGFKLEVTNESGEHDRWKAIQRVYRIDTDINQQLVRYQIDIPSGGIYVRPNSPLFVPLDELQYLLSDNKLECHKLRLKFFYTDSEGGSQDHSIDGVVPVKASLEEANSSYQNRGG